MQSPRCVYIFIISICKLKITKKLAGLDCFFRPLQNAQLSRDVCGTLEKKGERQHSPLSSAALRFHARLQKQDANTKMLIPAFPRGLTAVFPGLKRPEEIEVLIQRGASALSFLQQKLRLARAIFPARKASSIISSQRRGKFYEPRAANF